MLEWLWHSTVAWIGIGGAIIAALLAVAWFFPPFRRVALTAAGAVFTGLALYTKGAADQKRRDREKSDAAVRKLDRQYDEIERRPDDEKSVDQRLRRGDF